MGWLMEKCVRACVSVWEREERLPTDDADGGWEWGIGCEVGRVA